MILMQGINVPKLGLQPNDHHYIWGDNARRDPKRALATQK
jgi:hypothetical protein